jgi:hypothetical protein
MLCGLQKKSFVLAGVLTPDLAAHSLLSTPKIQVTYFMAFNPSKMSKKLILPKKCYSQTHVAALWPFLVPLNEELSI